MTDVYGYLSLRIPHADEWRGNSYVIERTPDGVPVVDIRLNGPVGIHLRSASADDLMKLRAVITAAITALGYGEDLPPMDAVQRVLDKLNGHKQLARARGELLQRNTPSPAAALWQGKEETYAVAARIVIQELVGAAPAQAVNEPDPAAVTELLKCECHE